MADTIYKLQQRVDNYSTEAQVYQEGSDRINIEIPGVTDANAILEELVSSGSLTFLEDGKEVLSGTDVADAQAAYQTNSMNNQGAGCISDYDCRWNQKVRGCDKGISEP